MPTTEGMVFRLPAHRFTIEKKEMASKHDMRELGGIRIAIEFGLRLQLGRRV